MKVEFCRYLPIKAVMIGSHYDSEKNDSLDVERIEMGQSNMSIKIMRCEKILNSVHFKFYLHNKEIDIYSSGLLNSYRALCFPMICYMEG